MKRLLAVLLAVIMTMCLFAGCGEDKNPKETVVKALAEMDSAVDAHMTLKGFAGNSKDSEEYSADLDIATDGKAFSCSFDAQVAGETQNVKLYFDGDATVYAGIQGQNLKVNFNDLETYLDSMIQQSGADEDSLKQYEELKSKLKELFKQENSDDLVKKSTDTLNTMITNATVEKSGDDSVYTLTIDNAKMTETLKSAYISVLDKLISIIPADESNGIGEQKAEIMKFLDKITYEMKDVKVTLNNGKVKSFSAKLNIPETEIENEKITAGVEYSFEIKASGKDVKVDSSVSSNAIDVLQFVQSMLGGLGDSEPAQDTVEPDVAVNSEVITEADM